MNYKKEDNMNRRTFLKGSVGLAGLALTAPYVARAAAGPLTLRFAHFAQEDHPANIAAKQFASRVEARTGGAIKINIFPNNSLGGPPEQAQQIKLGVIDMGLPTQGQLQNYEKAFGAVMLPFVFDSPAHVFRVLDGPAMAWLAPLAEKQGFIILRNWEYGFRNLTNSVRPINAPDDVKGLKDPHAGRAPDPGVDGGPGRSGTGNRLSGTLSGALAEGGRRRGEPDRGDLLQQVLRSAEEPRASPVTFTTT